MGPLYLGLMSGTSLDGVDGVLVEFGSEAGAPALRVLAHATRLFDPAQAQELLSLNTQGGPNELHRAALASNALARLYAQVVADVLAASGTDAARVTAIGAHGQTVRHRPGEFDGLGYTLQLNAPAVLAELTGINVVADFRTRDVAAGGQGAPLVPAFHRAVFGRTGRCSAVLNLGGMANLTALRLNGEVGGFDCGPGNVLLDHWCQASTGQAFDRRGAWAATGRVIPGLLAWFLTEPFFALPVPKSTGRDLFGAAWLDAHLKQFADARAEDIQATLSELTAVVCARDVEGHAPRADELLVCGGGALNQDLMARLQRLLPHLAVQATDTRGLPAQQVEACAFAWLAKAFVDGSCGNLASVTGARGPRILGALYPAG